jgi:hypothetical protein
MPAAILVIIDTAATFNPKNRAKITSGTVDIPTASAPNNFAVRISAGVSKLGPQNQTYTPSCNVIFFVLAAFLNFSHKDGLYAPPISTKRDVSVSPNNGETPVKFI